MYISFRPSQTGTAPCVCNAAVVFLHVFQPQFVLHEVFMLCWSPVAGAAGKKIYSNQYSLTEYYSPVHKGEVQLPAIYFMYDLSPIMVAIKDARASFAHLLVRLCAVVGGVFAITGKLP